jgi:hypothetical protein
MTFKVEDLVFRFEIRGATQVALKLEENKSKGTALGEEVEFDCGGRTNNGTTDVIEKETLDELLEDLREKLEEPIPPPAE